MTNPHCTESEITAFRKEALGLEERARVAAHLAVCSRCAETLAAERVAHEAAALYAGAEAPDDLSLRILTELVTDVQVPSRLVPIRLLAFALAGLMLIGFAFWLTRGMPWSLAPESVETHRPPSHTLPAPVPHNPPTPENNTPVPPPTAPDTTPRTSPPADAPSTEHAPATPPVSPAAPTVSPGTELPPDPLIVRGPETPGVEIRGVPGDVTVNLDPQGPAQIVDDLLAAARADATLSNHLTEGGIAVMPFALADKLPTGLGKAVVEAITDGLADGNAALAPRRKLLDALAAAGMPPDGAPENTRARAAATQIDAALYLLGEVTVADGRLRIHVRCYETSSGKEVAQAQHDAGITQPKD